MGVCADSVNLENHGKNAGAIRVGVLEKLTAADYCAACSIDPLFAPWRISSDDSLHLPAHYVAFTKMD